MPDSYAHTVSRRRFTASADAGPAVLYVVTRSVDQGQTAGLVSTLGFGAGNLFHVAASARPIGATGESQREDTL